MSLRTDLKLEQLPYGESVLQAPLRYIPPKDSCDLLIVAGIHGEEPDTTVALSRALRSIPSDALSPRIGVVLCANPDGVCNGTRGNENGVDLNRNFPTANWQSEPTTCRWHSDESLTLPISTGRHPGSEPETSALVALIERLKPDRLLALHGPLACIDDPEQSPFGQWLSDRTGLPLIEEIGYPTPGSMGTWASENDLPITTWEFPVEGIEQLSRSQAPTLVDILRGNHP